MTPWVVVVAPNDDVVYQIYEPPAPYKRRQWRKEWQKTGLTVLQRVILWILTG